MSHGLVWAGGRAGGRAGGQAGGRAGGLDYTVIQNTATITTTTVFIIFIFQ